MIMRTVRTVTGLKPELRSLFVVTLVFRASTMAFPFLATYLALDGGHGPAALAALVAAFGAGALAADVAASLLLGAVSPRAVMLTGLALSAATVAVVPLTGGFTGLFAVIALWGFGYELFTPASYAATITASEPDERKVAFACNRLAINVGWGVGPALGGLLFAAAPDVLFWINAAGTATAACVLVVGPTGARRADAPRIRRLRAPTTHRETQFWTILGLSLPIQLAYSLLPVFVGAYIIVGLGLPGYWAGAVFVLNASCIVLFEVPLNKAMSAMAHLPTLLIGYALTGVGFVLVGFAGSGPAVLAATLVWTAGEMVVFPGLLSYLGSLSDGPHSGRNMGVFSAGVNIAFIISPHLVFRLSDWGGPGLPWIVIGGSVCAACAVLLIARTSDYTWGDRARP